MRVSTGRQAEHDLSIPDQKAQTQAWVAQRGWSVVAEYVEAGASATDDKRAQFQRMIERACDGENAFDVVVVHSFSRFFRDAFGLEFYLCKLAKHGVKLVSITQELGDDPAQVMMRQVIALFDEYQSKENAKHVLRAMKENARQGFWNGARAPLGYAPPIITAALFDAVQKGLAARNPNVAPPRAVSGPILLTGLAACATCGGGMTLRAGTSRTGQVYRYYSCANAMQKGKLACKGRSIPMAKLDTLVTEHLAARLLQPDRLTTMLTALAGRRTDRQAALDNRIAALASEAGLADEKLLRLYDLVEKGLAQLDNVLKDRIEALQTSREIAIAALERAKSASRPTHDISPAAVDRFARAMRDKLSSGEIPFRKAYIRSIVDRIEVDDRCIRIMGRKDVLEQAVLAEGGTAAPMVHSFVPKWRTRQDSNL